MAQFTTKKPLSISDYATDISLYATHCPKKVASADKLLLVDSLLVDLLGEHIDGDYSHKRKQLHGKLNTLPPQTLNEKAIAKLDTLLQLEISEKDVVHPDDLLQYRVHHKDNTTLSLWQGDISLLAVDAIVNAANNQLLGCWHPLHACIDNVIHSAAGVQLRDDCQIIMKNQGFLEPTGIAKITRAYNLPAKFVLHTVGPIVDGNVTDAKIVQLANCYHSCLNICKEMDQIRSIAFCGISTGVFGCPPEIAAKVALKAVNDWLASNPGCLDLVVFNVFSQHDKNIYLSLFEENDFT